MHWRLVRGGLYGRLFVRLATVDDICQWRCQAHAKERGFHYGKYQPLTPEYCANCKSQNNSY